MQRLFLVAAFCLIVLCFAPRQILIAYGEKASADLTTEVESDNDKILTVARWISSHYTGLTGTMPAYYAAIPYLTHTDIPDPFRLPRGAIEFVTRDGECDSAARGLSFLLRRLGYRTEQVNFAYPEAHSALLVTKPSGKEVFVDPYFGLAAFIDGRLASLEDMVEALKRGQPLDHVAVSLRQNPNLSFYQSMREKPVLYAPQGEDMGIAATLPATNGTKLLLGKMDGQSDDLQRATVHHEMTAYFDYIGSRYDRAWTRTLRATEDIRIEFIAVDDIDDDLLVSNPKPHIDGRKATWTLKSGERLVLYDNRTPRQFLSPQYQLVDLIRIVPADS